MAETQAQSRLLRFGAFEVNLRTGELFKAGVRLKFSGQPFKVLAILLEQPGDVVTREELQKRLWPDTFVDAERNLNTAVNKIREVLGDSADTPIYVETLPRRGYRFIAPVETVRTGQENSEVEAGENTTSAALPARNKRPLGTLLAVGSCLLLGGAGWLIVKGWRPSSPPALVQRPLTRLTFDDGLQIGATWSPDGRYIAYSSDRGGKLDIWVQQVSGGDPIQITKRPGQNLQPNWSPDGKYIAYRSEQGEGGIFVIPALGGAGLERKISSFGYYPQWSPDSSQILFGTHLASISYTDRFYVARLDGSPPREVLAEWIAKNQLWATSAAWHPDGKRITVWVGSSSPTPAFWTVPLAGGPGVELAIPPAVEKELAEASGDTKANQQLGEYGFQWSPLGDAIYFARGYRGARNIWKLTIDPGTLRATRIARMTTGPGPDAALGISADGKRLAFTARSQRIQTWLFPFDAGTGQVKGEGRAISSPGRTSSDPTISPDGSKVAYEVPHGESYGVSNGDFLNEVWVKSLGDGSEFPVFADDYSRGAQHWSSDGRQLLYERSKLSTNEQQLMLWSSQTHEEEPLGAPNTLGTPYDWSRDGKWLLTYTPTGLWLIPFPSSQNLETGAKSIASNPAYLFFQPHMSPDDRWIVFEAVENTPNPESALIVVPASGGAWTRITDGRHWADKPRWSQDGKTIYFVLGSNGFFNVWATHFDPSTGKSVGQPFQISNFDTQRLKISDWIAADGLSLTQDKMVLTMSQESGNIWILDNVNQ